MTLMSESVQVISNLSPQIKAPASEMIFSWDRNTEVPPEEQNHFEALIKKQHEEVRFYKALILTDPITSAYKRVEIGDGVLISSGDDEATDEFYVARVDAMFDNGAAVDSKFVFVTWFFTFDEIPRNKRPVELVKNEVFLCVAPSEQTVDAETIIDVCSILWIPENGISPKQDSEKSRTYCYRKSFDGRKVKVIENPPKLFVQTEAAGYNSVRSKRNVKLTERGENYRMNLVPSTTKRKTKWQLKIPLKSVENSLPANTIYRKKAARTPAKNRNDFVERSVLASPVSASSLRKMNASAAAMGILQSENESDPDEDVPAPIKKKKESVKSASHKSLDFNSTRSAPSTEKATKHRRRAPTTASVTSKSRGAKVFREGKRNSSADQNRVSVAVTRLNQVQDVAMHCEMSSAVKAPELTMSSVRRSARSTKDTAMPRRGKRRGEARPANDVKCIDHVVTSDEDKGLDSDDEGDDQDYNVKNEDEVSSSTDDEIKYVEVKRRSSRRADLSRRERNRKSVKKCRARSNCMKTPNKNCTPRIPRRQGALAACTTAFDKARENLHVSAVPISLPCRDNEFQSVYSFVEGKMASGTGGCMYISGVPGTGKTATVMEVLSRLRQAVSDGELDDFVCVEINGMRLTEPHQAYVQVLKQLKGTKTSSEHASQLLSAHFSQRSKKSTLLIVDELDLLWTKKQDVMYHIFDWPTHRHARLIVLAIANTMDLPERIMMNRVSSRLGLTRLSFLPYNFKQLQEIVNSRLDGFSAFDADAVQLVARKVAAVSGDARRCLDICRRAVEIAERLKKQNTSLKLVGIEHVHEALQEMFSSPMINFMRNCSTQEKLVLRAIVSEFRRSGLEEATLGQVLQHHGELAKLDNLPPATVTSVTKVCNHLAASRLILLEMGRHDLYARVRLNVSVDDVLFALNADS